MQDTFIVDKINPDGKKFDSVSRIEAEGESLEMLMTLDVNTDVYPIKKNEKHVVLLTSTLNKDGSAVGDYYTQTGRDSIADKFDYIMQGKIYRISEEGSGANVKAEIYVSFGGLLMLLKGNPSYVSEFDLDQRLFLCMRRL
ncbi:DNA-directed RNA polymerases II, IV and V subunit 8B-like [Citrus clementina]|uniref:DNA-directed RNA polymerases II, IV and V subunit 8B-like n=1 Tax=Citrus clementina TaxID=85681 RepID=UPI000CED0A23|nr:DNA-directed RNA polymerases II, IV and V subunit 8B-like [Citrus x clementina]